MGIYDREYYRDDSPEGFSLGGGAHSMVVKLVIINVVVFLVDQFLRSPDGGMLSNLLSVRPRTLLEPWTWWRFVTYGFVHDPRSLNHILFNMFGLFIFGRDIEGIYGPRKFLGMYLTAIVLGSIVWSLTSLAMLDASSVNVPMRMLGASGAVTSVVILFCFHFPHRTILLMFVIPAPAWLLGVLLVAINVFGVQSGQGRVAYDVHLVGAAYGYFFFRTKMELGQFASSSWLGDAKRAMRRKPKLRVHAPDRFVEDELDSQADQVLDKLHKQGEASLSAKERRILEEYSRRMQRKRR